MADNTVNIDIDELKWRILTVLMFALVFTLLSILIPYAYYFLAPTHTFFQVEQFTVDDVADDDDVLRTHLIRESRGTYMGKFYIEANKVTSESRERVYYNDYSTVVEEGTHESIMVLETGSLESGDYRVVVSGYINIENGVNKYVSWQSNLFEVTEAEADEPTNETVENETRLTPVRVLESNTATP